VPTITQNANDVVATGDSTSSDGSTAWFRPSVAVKTVTFTFLNDDDSNTSTSRYWFAQNAAALPDTGFSSSWSIMLFIAGAALLTAGGLLIARRRS
jgi:LPXTG-motif cell wall-anchored protein